MSADEYFADGNRLFRDELYWAALLRYRQAREAGLDTPLLHYNEGVAHYRARQFERARESLTRALDSPKLRVTAQYNLGLAAWADGDTDAALRWFRLARDSAQDDKISEYARVAIARIRRSEPDAAPVVVAVSVERRREDQRFSRFDFAADVGFGSDSNAFRAPSEPYVDLSDPTLPVVTPEVQSGNYVPVDVRLKYRINAYPHEGFFAAYRFNAHHYYDEALENANEMRHELALGSEYRRRNEEKQRERRVYGAFEFADNDEVYYDPDDGGSLIVDDVLLDDRFDYQRYGPNLILRQSGRRLSLGLRVTGQLWDYEDTDVTPAWDHEYFLFALRTQYRFTETSLLRLVAQKSSRRFGERRARDLDGSLDIDNPELRYDYLTLALVARQRITDGMWFGIEYERRDRTDRYVGYNNYVRDSYGAEIHWQIGQRFDLELASFYRLYNYENAFAFNNPAAPTKTLETVDGVLAATFRMTKRLSLVLEAEYRDQVSTDARLEYERSRYSLGIRWQQ